MATEIDPLAPDASYLFLLGRDLVGQVQDIAPLPLIFNQRDGSFIAPEELELIVRVSNQILPDRAALGVRLARPRGAHSALQALL